VVKELQTKAGDALDTEDKLVDVVDDAAELVAITGLLLYPRIGTPPSFLSPQRRKDGAESGTTTTAPAAPAVTTVVDPVSVAKAIMDEAESRVAGPVLQCVQCGMRYREAENGEGHCRFHAAAGERRLWRTVYGCCNGDTPCHGGRHRAKHHTDYPYAAFFAWAQQMREQIAGHWLRVSRVDFEDDCCKTADAGALKDGRLYLRVFRGTALRFFTVLERSDVVAGVERARAAADRRAVIYRWTDTQTPQCYTEFYYCWSAELASAALGVVFKLASDTVCTEKLALLDTAATPIALLGTRTLSDKAPYAYPTQAQLDDAHPHFFREEVRTGPEIPAHVAIEPTVYSCEGDSAMRMVANSSPEASQDTWARDGKFGQYVVTVVTVTNPTDSETSIAKLTAEFKLGAAFSAAEKTFLGVPNGRGGHYFPENGFETVHLRPHDAVTLSLSAMIKVEGKPGDRNETRFRAAPSLPQPLKVRYTLHDASGKTVSLVVEQVNKALDLPSKQSCEASWKCDVLGWMTCDDLEDFTRSFVAFYVDGCGVLTVRTDGCYYGLTSSTLELAVYRARKANVSEYPLETLKTNTTLVALVDIAQGFVWGFRVLIKTATGTTESTFPFPDMARILSQFQLRLEPPVEAVKPGAQVTAAWSMLRANRDARVLLCDATVEDDSSAMVSYRDVTEKQGTVQLTAPTKEGTYNLRLIAQSKYESLACSANFKVVV